MKRSYVLLALSLLLSAPTQLLPLWGSDVKGFENLALVFKKSGNEADRQRALAEYQRITAAAAKRPAIRAGLQQALKNADITEAQLNTAITRAPGAGAPAAAAPAAPVAPAVSDADIRAAITRFNAALDKLRADALATLQIGAIRTNLDNFDTETGNFYARLTGAQQAAYAAQVKTLMDRYNELEQIHDVQRDIIDGIVDDLAYTIQHTNNEQEGNAGLKLVNDRLAGLPAAIRNRVNARRDVADLRAALTTKINNLRIAAAAAAQKVAANLAAAQQAAQAAQAQNAAAQQKAAADLVAAQKAKADADAKRVQDAADAAAAAQKAQAEAAAQRARDEKAVKDAADAKAAADAATAAAAKKAKEEAAAQPAAGAFGDNEWTRLKAIGDKIDAGTASGAEKTEFQALLPRAQALKATASKAQNEILEAATESAGLL